MKITVIGSGYVGLVVGACLSDAGNQVECVDIDQEKIECLSQGEVPFFEPGLESIVKRNVDAKRLSFTTDIIRSCDQGEVIFIAVGTPQGDDGAAELQYVYTVADQIGETLSLDRLNGHIQGLKIILTKSTVPIGTSDQVHQIIAQRAQHPFVVCSNPEFLKEGDALNDFLKPDRIILGVPSDDRGAVAEQVIRRLYSSFYRTRERLHVMSVRSSELTKYAANALLATKISFMNELALFAEQVGADIERVRTGIGSDPRIGYSFLFAGAGYGGSCFPKDVKALYHLSERYERPLHILNAVDQANTRQKRILFERAQQHFSSQGGIKGRRFAVWGLSFKPRTDDIREAPSLTLIQSLINAGAAVSAHDPEAMDNIAQLFKEEIHEQKLTLHKDHYRCVDNADALFIVTEWRLFHHPDFDHLKTSLRHPVIIDGRNLYDPQLMRARGIIYYGIGRGESLQKTPDPNDH